MLFIGLYVLSTVGFILAFQIRTEPYRSITAGGVFIVLFALFLRIQRRRRRVPPR
jgi:hypothetical protein